MQQTAPYVVQDAAGNTAIVIEVTAKGVKLIAVCKGTRQITQYRRVEYEKTFTQVDYPVDKAAQKYYSSLIPCHTAAIKELEEIMKTTASIVTVTPDAGFVGRFTDPVIAAKCSPDNALCCTGPNDLADNFTTAQLCEQLGEQPSKSIKKAEYAQRVWDNYMTKEVKMPEKKEKKEKAPKEPKAPKQGAVYHVHRICSENRDLTRAEIIELCIAEGINIATAKTQYQVWSKANLTEAEIAARKERAKELRPVKERAPRKPRAKKQKVDENGEIDNSEEQGELPL